MVMRQPEYGPCCVFSTGGLNASTDMPRILRILNRLNLGGPTYNAAYLSARLAPDFETLLVAGLRDEHEAGSEFIIESMGLQAHYLKQMRREISPLADWAAYQEIVQLINDFKPDIVHTHAAKAGMLGRLAAHRLKVPVVVHTFHGHVFHSYFGKTKTRIFIEIERRLSAWSDAIICISPEQKNDLCSVYRVSKSEQTHIIPLGFDLDRFSRNQEEKRQNFRSEYQLDPSTLAVGIIGRLAPVKNHFLFLESVASLIKEELPPVHFLIVGDGEMRKTLEEKCRELNIPFNTPESTTPGARLTFCSWILDIDRCLAGLDLVALSSDNEGTPVSLIEAQAASKPIVSTQTGGIADTVIAGKTALLSPVGDVAAFSASLRTLITDRKLREKMAGAGADFVRSKFGVDRMVTEVGTLYRKLLREKNR